MTMMIMVMAKKRIFQILLTIYWQSMLPLLVISKKKLDEKSEKRKKIGFSFLQAYQVFFFFGWSVGQKKNGKLFSHILRITQKMDAYLNKTYGPKKKKERWKDFQLRRPDDDDDNND